MKTIIVWNRFSFVSFNLAISGLAVCIFIAFSCITEGLSSLCLVEYSAYPHLVLFSWSNPTLCTRLQNIQ